MDVIRKTAETNRCEMSQRPADIGVEPDAEGFPAIPGRLGRIEWHDPEGGELAVCTDRPRLFDRLLAIPGVRRHKTGDQSSAPSSLPWSSSRWLA